MVHDAVFRNAGLLLEASNLSIRRCSIYVKKSVCELQFLQYYTPYKLYALGIRMLCECIRTCRNVAVNIGTAPSKRPCTFPAGRKPDMSVYDHVMEQPYCDCSFIDRSIRIHNQLQSNTNFRVSLGN